MVIGALFLSDVQVAADETEDRRGSSPQVG